VHKILRVEDSLTHGLTSVPWVFLEVWIIINNSLLVITVEVRTVELLTLTVFEVRSTLTRLIVARVVL
jgi:hypothetical protein